MKTKITVFTLCAVLFAFCGSVDAQQSTKIPRIGYLSGTGRESSDNLKGLRQGLRDLGYIEGKNILIEFRNTGANPDLIPNLVSELVQLRVDVLVVSTGSTIRAAKRATKTIPIVMVTTEDPVATGLIDSLARPGGNVTGLTLLTRELTGKRLELLKEVVPGISRVGYLLPDSPDADIRFKEYEAAARALKLQLQSLEIRNQNPDFEGAFKTAVKGRVSALITARNAVFIGTESRLRNLP